MPLSKLPIFVNKIRGGLGEASLSEKYKVVGKLFRDIQFSHCNIGFQAWNILQDSTDNSSIEQLNKTEEGWLHIYCAIG